MQRSYSTLSAKVRALEASTAEAAEQLDTLRNRANASDGVSSRLVRRIGGIEARLDARPNPAAVAAQVLASVFTVKTTRGTGSAWVLSSAAGRSLLVTNYHVVADVWDSGGRGVRLLQDDYVRAGSVLRVSTIADLALIETAGTLPALDLAAREPSPGDAVMVVGSPIGLDGSVTDGIVSAIRVKDGVRYLQFSAPVNAGNSGGPVVNETGEVVGVAVGKYIGFGIEGLSFAVPSSQLCAALSAC